MTYNREDLRRKGLAVTLLSDSGNDSSPKMGLPFCRATLAGTNIKFRCSLYPLFVLALVLGIAVGCSQKPARSDGQLAADVQDKIYGDGAIQSRQIGVQANNGAATIDGVKTVVNNLQVQQTQATPAPTPVSVQQVQLAPAPAHKSQPKPSPRHERRPSVAAQDNFAPAPQPTQLAQSAAPLTPTTAPQVQAAPPPPPPPPKKVTIPAGTQLTVRLNDPLDSERNQVGDTFHGSLGAPIVIDDETVIPTGADVVGRVANVQSAGRFAGSSLLTLELTSLSVNGKTYNIQTNQWSRQGKGEGKNTATKTAGGAALGAIIGGIAGGGKGAAIGTVAGAGAGAGVSATKKGEQIKLGPESSLDFQLINSLTVTPQSNNDRNAGRTPLG